MTARIPPLPIGDGRNTSYKRGPFTHSLNTRMAVVGWILFAASIVVAFYRPHWIHSPIKLLIALTVSYVAHIILGLLTEHFSTTGVPRLENDNLAWQHIETGEWRVQCPNCNAEWFGMNQPCPNCSKHSLKIRKKSLGFGATRKTEFVCQSCGAALDMITCQCGTQLYANKIEILIQRPVQFNLSNEKLMFVDVQFGIVFGLVFVVIGALFALFCSANGPLFWGVGTGIVAGLVALDWPRTLRPKYFDECNEGKRVWVRA